MGGSTAIVFDSSAFLETKIEERKDDPCISKQAGRLLPGGRRRRRVLHPSGKVKLTVVSTRGKEAVIGVLDRGSFFGEGCLAGQPAPHGHRERDPPSSIVRVDKKTMVRLLHREPEFAELFTAYLLSRNVRSKRTLWTSSSTPARSGWPGCCCCSRTSARSRGRRP